MNHTQKIKILKKTDLEREGKKVEKKEESNERKKGGKQGEKMEVEKKRGIKLDVVSMSPPPYLFF